MNIHIVPLADAHFASLREALDAVARETGFLVMTQTPPAEEAFAFYRHAMEHGHAFFVALREGRVVGWCDVLPVFGQARRHVGVLGIGVMASARRLGLGTRLMQSAIAKARAQGLARIELTGRADNQEARALYEGLGFRHEGLMGNGFQVDGVYHDMLAMALLDESALRQAQGRLST